MKNDGKDAEVAFLAYWAPRGHVQRIRDKKDLMGLNGGQRVADFKKPSDFLVSAPDVPLHYAEVKSTNDAVRFSFGKIQDGQSSAALQEAKRGSQSYKFYIFSYPLGQWFLMDCTEYADALSAGARSMKFEDMTPWVR